MFSKYTQLKRHISCHKQADPHNRGLQCSYCERWCATRSSLMRHERIHTGLYLPKNTRRNLISALYTLKNVQNQQKHFLLLPGEKPFKCDICNRSFVQKEILKRHYLIHTGEKPFICNHAGCKERFRQREQLKAHVNRCHTENPVFELHKCSLCPKSFCHASGLSRHLLSHAGKTFDCQICLKSYSDRSTLRRHMIAIHDEPTASKRVEGEIVESNSGTEDHDPAMYTFDPKPNIL